MLKQYSQVCGEIRKILPSVHIGRMRIPRSEILIAVAIVLYNTYRNCAALTLGLNANMVQVLSVGLQVWETSFALVNLSHVVFLTTFLSLCV